jgi:hypothetical protein
VAVTDLVQVALTTLRCEATKRPSANGCRDPDRSRRGNGPNEVARGRMRRGAQATSALTTLSLETTRLASDTHVRCLGLASGERPDPALVQRRETSAVRQYG